jgi:hypothetical protein
MLLVLNVSRMGRRALGRNVNGVARPAPSRLTISALARVVSAATLGASPDPADWLRHW